MKAWGAYALAALTLTAVGVLLTTRFVSPDARSAVVFGGALAWAVQLLAFALLIALRGQSTLFMAGWLGGMMLRFIVLGLVAFWLTRTGAFPLDAALLSLVGFVFLLLLLEPLFLRRKLSLT